MQKPRVKKRNWAFVLYPESAALHRGCELLHQAGAADLLLPGGERAAPVPGGAAR